MGNRQTIHRLLMLAVASSLAGVPAVAQLRSSSPVQAVAEVDAEVTVTWVFRAEDLFACETVAYDLRQVLGEHGNRVAVRAIAVGADSELVSSFFRKERLDIPVETHSTLQYRQAFGNAPSPALYITRRGQLVRSLFASQSQRGWEQGELELYELISQLLARPQAQSRAN